MTAIFTDVEIERNFANVSMHERRDRASMTEANVRDLVKVDLDGPKPRELAVKFPHRPLTTGMPKNMVMPE